MAAPESDTDRPAKIDADLMARVNERGHGCYMMDAASSNSPELKVAAVAFRQQALARQQAQARNGLIFRTTCLLLLSVVGKLAYDYCIPSGSWCKPLKP